MLVYSIYPIPVSELLYVSGVFGLSIMIGIISLFAPSGIGVRESIQLIGLSLIIPKEFAAIIIIVSRLWTTCSELILIMAATLVNKGKNKFLKKVEN